MWLRRLSTFSASTSLRDSNLENLVYVAPFYNLFVEFKKVRLEGTGQNWGWVSTGFYKCFSVSFLVLYWKKVLYLRV